MKSDLVTVLDLGSTKASCLAVMPDGDGGMEIKAFASVPCKGLRRGVLTDLEEASRSIDAVVRRVQQSVGQEITSLIVAVSGAHLEGLNAQGFKLIVPRGRHITYQDVLEVINHSRSLMLPPDREQIQALPREFRVDGTRDVRKPIGMSAGKLEAVTHIVTGQTSAIQNLEKAVTMAGKRVEQMILGPLAAGVGVLTQDEMELGTVMVDIGGGTTDIAIFTNGSLAHSASIPIGSAMVTSDISKLIKTSPEEAERLKNSFGNAYSKSVPERESVDVMQLGQIQARPLQRRVLCEIIESRMREIATMVRQQIEKSGLYAVLPGGIVITGGGGQVPGTQQLFEETIKHLRVRTAVAEVPGSDFEAAGAAVAVGMARFSVQCYDEIAPASGTTGWKDRVRSLFSIISGR